MDRSGHARLLSYVKSKRRDHVSIPSLEADGTVVTGAQEKAELINQQFTSVFTHENTSNSPDLGASSFPTIVPDITSMLTV